MKLHLNWSKVHPDPQQGETTWKSWTWVQKFMSCPLSLSICVWIMSLPNLLSSIPVNKHRRLTRINMEEVTLSHTMIWELPRVIWQIGSLQSSEIRQACQHTYQEQAIDKLLRVSEDFWEEDESRINHLCFLNLVQSLAVNSLVFSSWGWLVQGMAGAGHVFYFPCLLIPTIWNIPVNSDSRRYRCTLLFMVDGTNNTSVQQPRFSLFLKSISVKKCSSNVRGMRRGMIGLSIEIAIET